MTHTFDPPGHPAHDDPEVVRLMATVDTLTDGERRAFILNAVRYALAHRRTGDVAHLTEWRKNMLGTLHLRGIPAYVEAVRRPVPPRKGPARDLGEVLSGGKTAKAARDALRHMPGITLARRGGKDYCPKCPPEPTPR